MLVIILLTLFINGERPGARGSEIMLTSQTLMHRTVVISVEPDTIKAPPPTIGDTFRDSIYVSGITSSQPLFAVQVSIAYNKSVLRFHRFEVGSFMTGAALAQSLEDTLIGKISALVYFSGSSYVIGSGAALYVIWQVKSGGDSPFHILLAGEYYMETYLLDTNIVEIPFTPVDGYFDDTTYTPPGSEEVSLIKSYRLLLQNYPNPFSKNTVISYTVPQYCGVAVNNTISLTIYDLTGRLVKSFPTTQQLNNSMNSITRVWDGTADNGKLLPNGVYFCKLRAGNESITKRLLLLR